MAHRRKIVEILQLTAASHSRVNWAARCSDTEGWHCTKLLLAKQKKIIIFLYKKVRQKWIFVKTKIDKYGF